MLRLDNITKDYPLKGSVVHALKGLSICFRKSEFVSILGPSGCGKTTTLNIIGGLDHYTSGDLIINGVSTKQYKDHDWDVYRNHKIGFIFQSYNLIPHQNIEENVELALTIAGLGKEERKKRAREALDKVGLQGLYSKMPNQLSGGQCQRVAIARALVNEPDILLADEPTGALDSVTSVQIMDLIKEISQDKLVIMVTHNPDLAAQYSTRIVKLLDGELIEDSRPYAPEEEAKEREKTEAPAEKEKASMSWWTAFKLSAKNLLSKAKRTAMIVVASSIGIVGVSAVLAVSQGVTGYIDSIQDDMLSEYPVEVEQSSLDLSSLINSSTNMTQAKTVASSIQDGKVDIQFMIETLIKTSDAAGSTMVQNTITEDYIAFLDAMPSDYYAAMTKHYGFNIKNNLFTTSDIDGRDPSEEYSITGLTGFCQSMIEHASNGKYKSYASMIDSYTNAINECPDNQEYVLAQYDVVAGKYPTEANETMLVLNHNNRITEFILTLLGYYGQDDLFNAIYYYSDDTDNEYFDEARWEAHQNIDLSTLLGKTFTYYPNDVVFQKDESYQEGDTVGGPFTYAYSKSSADFPEGAEGTPIKVVGVLAPKSGKTYGCLSAGLYYTKAFANQYLQDNYDSEISKFLRDYEEAHPSSGGYTSSVYSVGGTSLISGIGFSYDFLYEGEKVRGKSVVGSQDATSQMMSLFSAMMGGASSSSSSASVSRMATFSSHESGGCKMPISITIYPKSFAQKYLVTDYLDVWNDESQTITLKNPDRTIAGSERNEIKYTDNLEAIIAMINNIINIVTIALIVFTALSLVVSTVMISIITYVSVMERVKEIGVIRSLGGRKRDVSHLFNAETFMIGGLSGLFGLGVTYLLELILNLTVGVKYSLGMIANLSPLTALIIFAIAILLTTIAGLLPSQSAARQDPVVALRTE